MTLTFIQRRRPLSSFVLGALLLAAGAVPVLAVAGASAGGTDPGLTPRPVHDASLWPVAQGPLSAYWSEWKAANGVNDLGHSTQLGPGVVMRGGFRADEVPVAFRTWVVGRAAQDGLLVVGSSGDAAIAAAQEAERVRAAQAAADAAAAAAAAAANGQGGTGTGTGTDGTAPPRPEGTDIGNVAQGEGGDPNATSAPRPDGATSTGTPGDGIDTSVTPPPANGIPIPEGITNVVIPTPPGGTGPGGTPTASRTAKEYSYGNEHERQKLDIYLPQGAGPFPLIVFFHGGGFYRGDKKDVDDFLPMLDMGYAFASCNYKLNKDPAAAADDSRKAVRFLREKIAGDAQNFPFDGRRFVSAGASAGGYLAALLGANGNKHGAEVNAVIDLAGPTDFLTFTGQFAYQTHVAPKAYRIEIPGGLGNLGGALGGIAGTALNPEYSAQRSATGSHPPALIRHGKNDPIIPEAQSAKYAQVLRQNGVYVWYETVDAAHGLTPELAKRVMEESHQFLQCGKVFGNGPCPGG